MNKKWKERQIERLRSERLFPRKWDWHWLDLTPIDLAAQQGPALPMDIVLPVNPRLVRRMAEAEIIEAYYGTGRLPEETVYGRNLQSPHGAGTGAGVSTVPGESERPVPRLGQESSGSGGSWLDRVPRVWV